MLKITDNTNFNEKSVDEIVKSCKYLSQRRIGALIAVERKNKIPPSEDSVLVDGVVSYQLISNLFTHDTPLHDGALTIRDNRVNYASNIFPVSESGIGQELGTRHRAAVGASEIYDAYIVVVSEETGAISLATNGRLERNISDEQLRKRLMELIVTDDDENYYGAIDLKELILARRDTKLDSIIMTSYPYVYGHEDIDDCIEQLKDYSEDLIPVLNNSNHLLGVITSQSIIQVVDEEMGEDYAKLAGLTTEEDLNEPLSQSMKKRLPWLLILLGLGTLVSTVVGVFEGVVSQLPLIICFQSLILDMAGNVGTQSLAVTIRVLMDETLTGKQKAGLVFKEMRVGFSNGLLLGVLSFLILGVYIYLFKGRSVTMAFAVSGCIGISLIVAMVISSMVGTLIPLFFNKINIDPAVASGPLITTVNDLVAVVTYYGLSWFLLLEVLHLA
jgi:cation transporter-like permease